jgi:hypothetical protein
LCPALIPLKLIPTLSQLASPLKLSNPVHGPFLKYYQNSAVSSRQIILLTPWPSSLGTRKLSARPPPRSLPPPPPKGLHSSPPPHPRKSQGNQGNKMENNGGGRKGVGVAAALMLLAWKTRHLKSSSNKNRAREPSGLVKKIRQAEGERERLKEDMTMVPSRCFGRHGG